MKTIIYCLLLLATCYVLNGQSKYQKLILDGDNPSIKSKNNKTLIESNCGFLSQISSWNSDLSKCNSDQCELYSEYTTFSSTHLKWIDDTKQFTEMDPKVGMEVEVIKFYSDGQEVKPRAFLSSRIDQCKSDKDGKSLKDCAGYFANLAIQTKSMIDKTKALNESSQNTLANMQKELTDEVNDLKGSRSPADIKKGKEKKDNLNSVKISSENASILIPALIQSMTNDYKIINDMTKTIKRLEKGL